ncbi:MAG: 1,4-dihydroxy-6-naphthoate synthase [Rikenellaceae bacterium]
MTRLKLHISPCPNDTFMFDALINRRIDTGALQFDVEYHDIEELNANALGCNSHADISKVSCAILPSIASSYTLLESGAALGRGNGPLLVKRRGEDSPLRQIATPGLHTTASALVKKLCPQVEQQHPMLFSEIAAAVARGEFDGGVLIHEGRFVYDKLDLELVCDLGLLWEERFDLPLPLGAIVMRSSIDQATRTNFERLLRQSIEYGFANPFASRTYIKEHAQELDDEVIDKHIDLFVNKYSLHLGDLGHQAINTLSTR